MGGINIKRWLLGGVVAGVLVWLLEGAASVLYMDTMQRSMEKLGLSLDMSATVWVLSVVVSLLLGLTLVFFYAACRPRFGPGPKTAVLVAVVLWAGGYVLSLIGYYMIKIYPTDMLVIWGIIGLLEMILASILGAWIYREE